MKKNIALILVLMASLVMGATCASAAQIKATGDWTVSADWQKGSDFDKNTEDNTFGIGQRMRTAFQFIASENLRGVLETQIGSNNWGNGLYQIGAGRSPATAAQIGANGNGNGNIMLRQGYIDFKVPSTTVNARVGYQAVSLPAAVGGGSAIFDDMVGAAVLSSPITDNVSVLGGYARLIDGNAYGATSTASSNGNNGAMDVAFLAAPMNFMNKGLNVTPFFAYGYAGATSGATGLTGFMNSNSSGQSGMNVYWGGVATTIKLLDPFVIMADFNYGKASYTGSGAQSTGGRSGWLFDMAVDYTGLSMMTPSVFFAYSSGENGNSSKGSGKSERMPVAGSPQNWALGSFWLQGSNGLNMADGLGGTTGDNLGFWALGLSLKDIKFFDKISHTANVIYFKGTNDVDYLLQKNAAGANVVNSATYGHFLTTKDSLWEVDLNTKYQMYDELALHLQLGYINTSFNKDAWAPVKGNTNSWDTSDAYKVSVVMNYTF